VQVGGGGPERVEGLVRLGRLLGGEVLLRVTVEADKVVSGGAEGLVGKLFGQNGCHAGGHPGIGHFALEGSFDAFLACHKGILDLSLVVKGLDALEE
jgi:hypothetical protein